MWITGNLEEECYGHGGSNYGYTDSIYIDCCYTDHESLRKLLPLIFLSRYSMEQGNIIAGGSSETGVDNAGTLCLRYIIAVCELDQNWSVTHQID